MSCSAARVLAFVVVAVALPGCASGPTLEEAREHLDRGDPQVAYDMAHQLLRRGDRGDSPEERQATLDAERVAFDAGLALGRSDLAAHTFLDMAAPAREQERLRERLAGSTLRIALESSDGGRRAIAAAELGVAAAHPKLLRLADLALGDREPAVRRAALGSVARIPDSIQAAQRLAHALGDGDDDVRETAAVALAARLGRPRSGEAAELAEARAKLLAAKPPAEALALVGAEPLHGLAPALERSPLTPSQPHATSRGALDAAAIARGLASTDPIARRRAWLALDRAEPSPVEKLLATLEAGDPALAPDAARLLAERGGAAVVPALLAALRDARSPARVEAARALGALGGPEAVAALVAALGNSDGALRRAAAEGLARAGNASVLGALSSSLTVQTDDSDLAAAAAVLAIEARTGPASASSVARPQEGP